MEAQSKQRVVVALAAVVGAALALWSMRQGPGISPDSVTYASVARNFAHGHGLRDFSGEQLTIFPPGFPFMLAVGEWVGVGVENTGMFLNVIALVALIVMIYVAVRRHVATPWVAEGVTLAAGLAVGLVDVFGMLWSEPLFCVVSFAAVLQLERIARDRGAWSSGYPFAVGLTFLACMLRYAGLTLIALGMVVVAVANRRRSRRSMLVRSAVFGLVASTGLIALVVRNLALGVGPLGERRESIETPTGVARSWMRAIGSWVVPGGRPTVYYYLVSLTVIVLIGIGFILRARIGAAPRTPLTPMILWLVGYTAYLSLSELLTPIDPIDVRLTSPIFPVAVVAVGVAIEVNLVAVQRVAVARGYRFAGIVGGLLVVALLAPWSMREANRRATSGVGFNSVVQKTSPLGALASRLPNTEVVVSNNPLKLYWASGRQPVLPTPQASYYRSSSTAAGEVSNFTEMLQGAADKRVFLVWFEPSDPSVVDLHTLQAAGLEFRQVDRASDGAIYEVTLG